MPRADGSSRDPLELANKDQVETLLADVSKDRSSDYRGTSRFVQEHGACVATVHIAGVGLSFRWPGPGARRRHRPAAR